MPSEHPEEQRFLTVAEVADTLRCTIPSVLTLCREGKIPATKPAGRWLIPEGEFRSLLREKRNDQGTAA